jgi:hypothetical protein
MPKGERLELQTIEIPKRSPASTQLPAIGLAAKVYQEGQANPFDLGESLSRPASSYLRADDDSGRQASQG